VRQVKIFGREPALWLALIGALVTWGVSLGLDWLNAGQATAIITFITAVVIAFTTRPVGPPLFAGAVAAGAALFAEYGLSVSQEAVTGLGAIVLAAFALFGIRPQVTPVADPRTIDGQVVTRRA
jgi:hypothetical protein